MLLLWLQIAKDLFAGLAPRCSRTSLVKQYGYLAPWYQLGSDHQLKKWTNTCDLISTVVGNVRSKKETVLNTVFYLYERQNWHSINDRFWIDRSFLDSNSVYIDDKLVPTPFLGRTEKNSCLSPDSFVFDWELFWSFDLRYQFRALRILRSEITDLS